jgi:PST family polysaccharide transporter
MSYSRLRALLTHQISRNMLALYWVQMAAFVVPLITLPYVSRVLGPSAFGLVIFSQGFSVFLMLFVDWGFTPYGLRKVAQIRNDPEALKSTVGHVRTAQLLMAALSVPIAIGAVLVIPKFARHPEFLIMAWAAAVSAGLMANWFFVGIERARTTAFVQLGFRIAGAALTFLLVEGPGDAWIVMALYAISCMGMWVVSDTIIYRRVRFRLHGLRAALVGVQEAGRLFVGTIGVSLLSTFNVVLLGLFVPSAQVAQYGASERIVRTWEQLFGPVDQAVYPRLTFLQASGRHGRARKLAAIAVAFTGGAAVLVAVLFGVFAPVWIRIIFGPRYVHEASPILRILVLLIPMSVVLYIVAIWLMSLHRDRTLVRVAIVAGLSNVALGSVLTLLLGPEGMALSVVTVQWAATGALLIAAHRISDPDKSLFPRRRPAGEASPRWQPGGLAGSGADESHEEVHAGEKASLG